MKLIVKNSTIIETSLLFSVIVLVFLYDTLSKSIGFFDELFALFSFGVILSQLIVKRKICLFKNEFAIIIFLIIILLIGLISNAYNCYKGFCTDSNAIFSDIIIFSKAFVAYFAVRMLSNKYNSTKTLKKISKYSEIIFYILVVFVFFDVFLKIYPREYRFGLESIELFFQHTSRYAFAFSFIFLVLLPKYYKNKLGLLFFVLFIGALSLRVKYFGFLFLSLTFWFYGKKMIKTPKPVFFWTLGILTTLMGLFFWDKIIMYFSFESLETAWSRAVILYYSIIIGIDYFPIGTGFGTYSSYYSGEYYSWVYDLYGISNVYGIKRTYWNFIADQYWPMVLGQFGYIGLISMFLVMYNYLILFLNTVKYYVNNNRYYMYLSVLLGLFMLLIDSTSDAIFSQQRAVVMFIYFALVMNTVNQRESITN